LVDRESAVATIFLPVCRLHVSTEITAINFNGLTFATDNTALHFLSHRFAQFMRQHKTSFVRRAEIARQCESALSLHLVCKDGDCKKIRAQRHFMRGEQRAGRDAEILTAFATTEARRTLRASAIVSIKAAARLTDWRAIGCSPADLAERRFDFRIRHFQDGGEAEGLCFPGK
jgi:hypothetical protein